jgi:hypothetical protein
VKGLWSTKGESAGFVGNTYSKKGKETDGERYQDKKVLGRTQKKNSNLIEAQMYLVA